MWLYPCQEFLLLENGWLLVVWWWVWLLRGRFISNLKWLCRWVHIVHSDLLLLALDLIYSCHWFYLCVIILCSTVISLFDNYPVRSLASTGSVILFRIHTWLPMSTIRTLDLISRLSLFHLPCCGWSILISVLQGILKFNSSIWDRHTFLLNCKCRLSISQDPLRHFWVAWPRCHALWICCLELHQMVFPLTVRIVLSIIARLCSNHFLWIWWLLSTELRWSLGHFFCTFWKSNWVLLPESHWFCLVFSCLFLAKLCVFCFD